MVQQLDNQELNQIEKFKVIKSQIDETRKQNKLSLIKKINLKICNREVKQIVN